MQGLRLLLASHTCCSTLDLRCNAAMTFAGVGTHAQCAGAAAQAPLPHPAPLHAARRWSERHACSRHGRCSQQATAAVRSGAGAPSGGGGPGSTGTATTRAAAAATVAAEPAVHEAAPTVMHPRAAAPPEGPPPAAQRGTQPAAAATASAATADDLAALAVQLGVPPREALPRHLAVIMVGAVHAGGREQQQESSRLAGRGGMCRPPAVLCNVCSGALPPIHLSIPPPFPMRRTATAGGQQRGACPGWRDTSGGWRRCDGWCAAARPGACPASR